MGYWGEDIFDNDGTRDALNEAVAPLLDAVANGLDNPNSAEWDEVDSSDLIAKMAMCKALIDAGLPIERFPDSRRLAAAMNRFSARWLKYSGGDNTFQLARLRRIEGLADAIIAAARNSEALEGDL